MAEIQPAWPTENRDDHPVVSAREWLRGFVRHGGVAHPDDFEATWTSDLDFEVSPGSAFVVGSEDGQGTYHVFADSTKSASVEPGDADDRLDRVVVRVQDTQHGGAADEWDVFVVKGTPGASPSLPDPPDHSVDLWQVSVAASASAVAQDDFADLRRLAGGAHRPGEVVPWAGDEDDMGDVPSGYLVADGSDVLRSEYPDLFDAIGETHGAGDESTTFGLPDLRGRVPLGKDDMGQGAAGRVGDAAASQVGGSGGVEEVAIALSEYPAHSHAVTLFSAGSHAHGPSSGSGFWPDSGSGFDGPGLEGAANGPSGSRSVLLSGNHTHAVTFGSSGVGSPSAHENLAPYQTVLYLVAY